MLQIINPVAFATWFCSFFKPQNCVLHLLQKKNHAMWRGLLSVVIAPGLFRCTTHPDSTPCLKCQDSFATLMFLSNPFRKCKPMHAKGVHGFVFHSHLQAQALDILVKNKTLAFSYKGLRFK